MPWERERRVMPWDRPRVERGATVHNPQPGAVYPLPGTEAAAAPSRPPMPSTGTVEQFGSAIATLANRPVLSSEQYEGIKATVPAMARTVGHNLLPALVEQETPEQGRLFDQAMTELLAIGGGGIAGRAVQRGLTEAGKYIGRGMRTRPGAEAFMRQSAPLYAGQPAAEVSGLIAPTVSGAAVATAIDATDLAGFQPHELAGDTAAAVGGAATAWKVGKNTVDDLMVTNPRWRDVMMRPARGTALAVLGGLLGFMASRGIEGGKELANDAADYVAGLFEDEELQ